MTRSSHRRAHRHLPFATPARCGASADERRGRNGSRGWSSPAFCTSTRSSPPSVAKRPRAAARSAMSGASLPGESSMSRASLVAPLAANVPQAGARSDDAPRDAGVLIATFRCAAPARCGAFADGRRVVAGDASLVASFAPGAPSCGLLETKSVVGGRGNLRREACA
jgi:hypothetical protein